jgi:hypothetical protein
MERVPRTLAEASQLIELGKLLNETIPVVINEWSKEKYTDDNGSEAVFNHSNGHDRRHRSTEPGDNPQVLPSWRLHQAQRSILAIAGSLVELMAEPYNRLQEFAAQFWEARVLAVSIERRIPDLLAEAGDRGMHIKEISEKTGVEPGKLCKTATSWPYYPPCHCRG